MSLGEIGRIAGEYTALGMGIVFTILIFISICIWLLGIVCRPKKKPQAPEAAPVAAEQQSIKDPSEIEPEIIAVITAAIHQHMQDEYGDIAGDQYIVRKVRRATWKHTS